MHIETVLDNDKDGAVVRRHRAQDESEQGVRQEVILMSIQRQTQTALQAMTSFSGGSQPLVVSESGQRLTVDLVALDTLACGFERFAMQFDSLAGAPLDRLEKIAKALSGRLTYLLEAITPVEIDADQCLVQLRSNPPRKQDDGTSYYELLVKRTGEISLCRFNAPRGAARQIIPAHVTREVLLHLVADFSAVG